MSAQSRSLRSRRTAAWQIQSLRFAGECGNGSKQPFRIRMFRICKNGCDASFFNDSAGIHDHHSSARIVHNAEIMSDQKNGIEALSSHTNRHKKQAAEKAVRMLETVGLPRADQLMKQYPHELSGGMRRRRFPACGRLFRLLAFCVYLCSWIELLSADLQS